jgi:hypothetical protein
MSYFELRVYKLSDPILAYSWTCPNAQAQKDVNQIVKSTLDQVTEEAETRKESCRCSSPKPKMLARYGCWRY